jgi:hypothetical protein
VLGLGGRRARVVRACRAQTQTCAQAGQALGVRDCLIVALDTAGILMLDTHTGLGSRYPARYVREERCGFVADQLHLTLLAWKHHMAAAGSNMPTPCAAAGYVVSGKLACLGLVWRSTRTVISATCVHLMCAATCPGGGQLA